MNVPQHIAIILDGNGRWAKKRGMPRNYGHSRGGKNVETICRAAYEMGVKYLTVYAFSTENWNRPADEVAALMDILRDYLKSCIRQSDKNNMRVRVIGDITALDDDIREKIEELKVSSAKNTGLNLQIALSYGSRDEIVRAARRISADVAAGRISSEDIGESLFASYLDTADIPDPDLLIRPGGEIRLSNYLLWQLAYSELYFTDVLWPDFSADDLRKAVESYNLRERRYGGVEGGDS